MKLKPNSRTRERPTVRVLLCLNQKMFVFAFYCRTIAPSSPETIVSSFEKQTNRSYWSTSQRDDLPWGDTYFVIRASGL